MNQPISRSNPDERSRQLTRLGLLLHVGGVLPLLLGLVLYHVAIRAPQAQSRRELVQRIRDLKDQLAETGQVRGQLSAASADLARLQASAAEIRRRIPETHDVEPFVMELSRIADESGLTVTEFRRGETRQQASYSQTDIHLDCTGDYDSICRFLDALEHVERVARVTAMEIKTVAGEQYPLSMTIRLYYGLHMAIRHEPTAQTRPRSAPDPSRQKGAIHG